MNGLLLFCILGALLCAKIKSDSVDNGNVTTQNETIPFTTSEITTLGNQRGEPTAVRGNSTTVFQPTGLPIRSKETPTQTTRITTTSTTARPESNTFFSMFCEKKCHLVVFVSAGLILACIILLVSTLLLGCKVCQLNRRIKALSSNGDLISNTEYWMGTAKGDKDKAEVTEVKETSILMADVSQAQEEMANGTTREEGGMVKEDGQVGEEDKKKEEEDNMKSEDVSETVAETASSSQPQEEAADPEPSKAVAASSSEGAEEPKDAV